MDKSAFYYESAGLKIRDTVLTDVIHLKDHLRSEEVMEIWAGSHNTPEQALLIGYLYSKITMTIEIEGVPVAMMGVIPEPTRPRHACVWLLASPDTAKTPVAFVRATRRCVKILQADFDHMSNHIDLRCARIVPWLRALGAEIHDPKPYGPEGAMFCEFTITKDGA